MQNGWLILDKPTGMSSAQAVGRVKRIVKPGKIGHAGTLDPLASGVLPLALGEATKTINYMMDKGKAYEFTVSWGTKTDTDDAEGKPVATSKNRPKMSEIEGILPRFMGKIMQIPPAFSAIKVAGERAYDLARAGEEVELKAREVRVDSLTIIPPPIGGRFASAEALAKAEGGGHYTGHLSTDAPLPASPPWGGETTTFLCHCGKGTYIRSLARDMGDLLGCYGHVTMLRRLKVGKFSENHAISLESLEELVHKGRLELLLVESALDDILALDITPDQAMLLKRGQAIPAPLVSEETVLTRSGGKPVALCTASQGWMKPSRVFNL